MMGCTRRATVAGDHLRGTAVVVENAPKSLPWCINTGKSLIPLTLLFLAQKRNLLIPLELSGVMHQGTAGLTSDPWAGG